MMCRKHPTKGYIHPKYKLRTKSTTSKDEEQKFPHPKNNESLKLLFKHQREVFPPQRPFKFVLSKCSEKSHQQKPTPYSFLPFYQRSPPCQKIVPNGIRHNPRNAQTTKSKLP